MYLETYALIIISFYVNALIVRPCNALKALCKIVVQIAVTVFEAIQFQTQDLVLVMRWAPLLISQLCSLVLARAGIKKSDAKEV